uniref:FHF complex subunit HOOK-interacting protein C-terminal domain-containing protein n=1 Tax=Timema douglasi TaxID=61478 RepID=A0A7R8VQV1_TIMDO|nr:unnamed protein product [Timema douglasi]
MEHTRRTTEKEKGGSHREKHTERGDARDTETSIIFWQSIASPPLFSFLLLAMSSCVLSSFLLLAMSSCVLSSFLLLAMSSCVFLLLLPQPLHSATDPGDEGYEQYVQDADRQYQLCVTRCSRHSWPNEATFPDLMEGDDSHSSDSRPEADHDGNGARNFYEGPFLRMLFTRLVRLPYQPYEINLQLTSLVSRLAMLPHPYLHEYLLNPFLPVLPDTNTLFGTLELVAAELVTQIPLLKSYKQALYATRQRLLEGICDPQEETNSILESVIVLEEFSKELSAIAFVKTRGDSAGTRWSMWRQLYRALCQPEHSYEVYL